MYGILLAIVTVFAISCGLRRQDRKSTNEKDTAMINESESGNDIRTESSETEIIQTEMPESDAMQTELSAYYGAYRITEFCPTVYYSRRDGDCMLKQEADMMLNRIVGIFPERLTTYGVERGLGTQGGRYGFENYAVERYVVDNPQYQWKKISGTEKESLFNPACGMEGAVGKDIFDGIDGKIMTPQLYEPFGLQEFYTVRDKNKLILHSDLSGEYFLLE